MASFTGRYEHQPTEQGPSLNNENRGYRQESENVLASSPDSGKVRAYSLSHLSFRMRLIGFNLGSRSITRASYYMATSVPIFNILCFCNRQGTQITFQGIQKHYESLYCHIITKCTD